MSKISWRIFAANLSSYDEASVERMLAEEIKTHKRAIMAQRLHQRLCTLRAKRERAAIMKEIKR